MRKCPECITEVTDDTHKCPVCKSKISGEITNRFVTYPTIYKVDRIRLYRFLFLLFSIISTIVVVIADFQVKSRNITIPHVFFILLLNVFIFNSLNFKKDISSRILLFDIFLMLYFLSLDYFVLIDRTEFLSLLYIAPIVLFASLSFMIFFSLIDNTFAFSSVLHILILIASGVLYYLITFSKSFEYLRIPSIVCFSLSVFCFLTMIIVHRKIVFEELKKRFHI
ncbi:MAG: DUF6320 domain-containing protein [Anaeroplasmataceae bacterium]